MSRESMWWLNNMVLVGYTDSRNSTWRKDGMAWHYRTEYQGAESNHYPGAIPVDDVIRRLFNFEFVEAPVYYLINGEYVPSSEGRKGMLTSDTREDLGSFKAGYQGHSYREWLLEAVADLLDNGDIGIGSAMLLRKRGQAAVSVEMPENITTPEGVEFRPTLLAVGSFDGSLATTYKRVFTDVVCDNSKDLALSEDGQQYKVKHTKYSKMKLKDAKDALAIVHMMGADFAAEVASLCAKSVSDAQFKVILDNLVPVPDDAGRGKTLAESKRAELIAMYHTDDRCAPWKGTAYGVLQTFNTWNHHKAKVMKGVPRFIRNMENVVNGSMATKDNEVLKVIEAIAV